MAQLLRMLCSALVASIVTVALIVLLKVPVGAQSPKMNCMSIDGVAGGFAANWMNQQLVAGKANFIEVSNTKLLCAW